MGLHRRKLTDTNPPVGRPRSTEGLEALARVCARGVPLAQAARESGVSIGVARNRVATLRRLVAAEGEDLRFLSDEETTLVEVARAFLRLRGLAE